MALLTFASSAFVPVVSMPGWLQPFTRNQPVSVTIEAMRALVLGDPASDPVLKAAAWSIGILVVAATLAVGWYRRTP